MNRRQFLQSCGGVCVLAASGLTPVLSLAGEATAEPHDAEYWERLPDGRIRCLLCPNGCVRAHGERSLCRAREPRNGVLKSLVWGNPCVLALDPIEKCPLFHFQLPGPAFSIATAGCNLACSYCQNWQFSQKPPEETRNFPMRPADVIAKALEYKAAGVAFFYTEPTIYIEYMKDVARAAREKSLKTIMVTAGSINEKPLADVIEVIDAFTIGLKGFSEEYYRTVVKGSLKPVLAAITQVKAAGKHFELVNLLVPTLNDAETDVERLTDWVGEHVGADVPLHFTRFNPQFQLKSLPQTPVPVLERSRRIARRKGLRYVYTGNLPGHEGNHTICPGCNHTVIERLGFQVLKNRLQSGACPDCGRKIPGSWQS